MNTVAKLSYAEEKEAGVRLPSGALPLKRLSGRHYTIINYHLEGRSGGDIAKLMKIAVVTVSKVLNDPLAQEVIKQRFVDYDRELRALMPEAVDALRTGLRSGDPNVQLSAADKFFRANGNYAAKKNDDGATSAEDIVQLLLAKTKPGEAAAITIGVRRIEDATGI